MFSSHFHLPSEVLTLLKERKPSYYGVNMTLGGRCVWCAGEGVLQRKRGESILADVFPVCACVFSHVQLFATTRTGARQAPLSIGFSRQEYGSLGCHFFLWGIFPTQGLNPCLLPWQVDSSITEPPGNPIYLLMRVLGPTLRPDFTLCPLSLLLSKAPSSQSPRPSHAFLRHRPSSTDTPLYFPPGTKTALGYCASVPVIRSEFRPSLLDTLGTR